MTTLSATPSWRRSGGPDSGRMIAASAAERCFWAVEPSGDHATDDATGEDFALAYLRCRPAPALPWIVAAMPRGKLGPIEISFMSVNGWVAIAGPDETAARLFPKARR